MRKFSTAPFCQTKKGRDPGKGHGLWIPSVRMIRCRWPTPADQCYTTNTKKGFVSFEVQSFVLPFNLTKYFIEVYTLLSSFIFNQHR
jgi:hypothetical protein